LPLSEGQLDFITFCDQFWGMAKCFPGQDEIRSELGLTSFELDELISDELVQKHLKARGIDSSIYSPVGTDGRKLKPGELRRGKTRRLTDIQLAVANSVLNVADRRSTTAKLESLGVSPTTFNGWKKNPIFMDYFTKLGGEVQGANLAEIHTAIAQRAASGSVQAAKLVYEVTGHYRPQQLAQNQTESNLELIILRLIEILQKHISDPELLKVIAGEIQEISNPNQKQLMGQESPSQATGLNRELEPSFGTDRSSV